MPLDAPTGYRNRFGTSRKLAFTSGTIEVKLSRVRGLEDLSESGVLTLLARRPQEVGQLLLPEFYWHGLPRRFFSWRFARSAHAGPKKS